MRSQTGRPHFSLAERMFMLAAFAVCVFLSWLLVLRVITFLTGA